MNKHPLAWYTENGPVREDTHSWAYKMVDAERNRKRAQNDCKRAD